MTGLHDDQAEYWYQAACRRAELIGGITACVESTHPNANPALTPAKAIERIGQLLTEFDAESAPRRPEDPT